MMLVGIAGLVWACDDSPLADGAGEGEHLVGYPSALFISPGEVKTMEFELLDENGSAQRTEWTVDNVTGDITVSVDEAFKPDYDEDGVLGPPDQPSRIRVNVTGGDLPEVASFDVTGGGVTETFSVRVVPTAFEGTFAEAPIVLDTVTLTATAPFGFAPGATITSASGFAYETISVAGDGTSITFVPSTSEAGALTIEGATLSYIPGATFTFETANTDGIGSPFAGQTDPGTTAPTIDAPAAVGDSVMWVDGATIAVDQFYRVSIPAAGSYLFTAAWDTAADEDMLICNADCSAFLPGGTAGATGANPENATIVAAGPMELIVWINLYDAHDDPAPNFRLQVKRTL
jgi:hypothetical protein